MSGRKAKAAATAAKKKEGSNSKKSSSADAPSTTKESAGAKKASVATPKIPKTVLDKIIVAIRSQPASAGGVSRTAIAKYLKAELDFDNAANLKLNLKKGVTNGTLIQTGQSFRVAGDPVAEAGPEEKLQIEDIKDGKGHDAKAGDTVVMKYEGKLEDGSIFDSSNTFEFTLGAGEVIKGWDQGIVGMKVGGQRKLSIPSKLGYGKRGAPPEIPPNADLFFVVTLKKIKT